MATFSHDYNPDQRGATGFEPDYGDVNEFEESMQHPRHTVAGIDERANCLEPFNAENRDEVRMEMLFESIETVFGTWL